MVKFILARALAQAYYLYQDLVTVVDQVFKSIFITSWVDLDHQFVIEQYRVRKVRATSNFLKFI